MADVITITAKGKEYVHMHPIAKPAIMEAKAAAGPAAGRREE